MERKLNRTQSHLLLGIAGLSVAIMGGLAAMSCGGDDNSTSGSTASQSPAQTTLDATSTPTKSAPRLGEAQIGNISITGASVRETANDVTAMYMTIKTTGPGDRLVSASTPISTMVQLHEVVMVNGAMQMQEIAGGIVIPPAGEVVLKTGGLHVMISNLKAPLKADQTVTFELTFEKAGKVSLTAPVKPIADTTGMGSSGGGMGGATPMATKAP
jgi:copper(I)-binding protein